MPHRDWKFRIQDILDAIGTVQKYTQGMEFKTFTGDRRTVDAVVRNLIIIGEAAVYVPEDIFLKHPEVPWYDMRGMRNFVVHEYFKASDAVIWDTVQLDLSPLPALLKKILDEN
ncbi:MAG: hypothetical protein SRB2_01931 [Desulfobacteraceae bacterium Eth-SRB2]|nr:MAG: hypothetical protein SRB2_01931 [Desulfobacteraceae bacterium Eth-SRB2]